jgi:hypothetical protein
MLKKVIIIIIMLIVIIKVGNGIDYRYIPGPSMSSGAPDGSSGASSGGSSHDYVPNAAETISVNVTREILDPIRDDGFFNDSNETIVFFVKITSSGKVGLKDLEIWEMPGAGLRILNCSYPIITSSISEIQEYKLHDKSFLENKDIIDAKSVIKKLQNNTSIIYQYVYSLLDEDTKSLISNKNTTVETLTNALVEDFNKIINDNSSSNFNSTHFRGSDVILSNSIFIGGKNRGLFQGFSNQSKSFLENDDFRLFKRRLLEEAFPEGIRKIRYYKEHENYNIGKNSFINIGINTIGEAMLNQKESIIFKYYLAPDKIGKTEIDSVIRADDFYQEEKTVVNIIEREPRFLVTYTTPSREIAKGKWHKFEYHITYLGGDDDEKLFNVSIDDDKSDFFQVNTTGINRGVIFRKGSTEDFLVPVKYLKEGSHLARPLVSIEEDNEKIIEADLSVYDIENLEDKLHYESKSNKIAYNLSIVSFFSLIILAIEVAVLIYIEYSKRDK